MADCSSCPTTRVVLRRVMPAPKCKKGAVARSVWYIKLGFDLMGMNPNSAVTSPTIRKVDAMQEGGHVRQDVKPGSPCRYRILPAPGIKIERRDMEPKTIKIDDIEYVRADSIKEKEMSGYYVIVRTYSAGVFAGHLKRREGQEVELTNARRIWYWDGAASLSQLAMEGSSKPQNCKFPCPVNSVVLTQAVEILCCTKKAERIIKEVAIWQQ